MSGDSYAKSRNPWRSIRQKLYSPAFERQLLLR